MAGNDVRFRATMDDKVSGTLDKLRDKFEKIQKQGAKGLAIGVGAAAATKAFDLLGSAVGAASQIVGDSIKNASDLAENQSKVNVVFGKSAPIINTWAKGAATAMGASEKAALGYAGTLGNLFDALGLTEDAQVDMTKGTVQLAADLASFNNLAGGTEEALEKLRAGLVGEAEPLRSLGVNLNAAMVEDEALRLGLAKTKKEITESAKVQARYSLILKQSTNAQGDFARTSDGVANKQRILDAKLEDISTRIGQALIPVMDGAVTIALKLADGFGLVGEFIGLLVRHVEGLLSPLAQLRDRLEDIGAFGPDSFEKLEQAAAKGSQAAQAHLNQLIEKQEAAARSGQKMADEASSAYREGERSIGGSADRMADKIGEVGEAADLSAQDVIDMVKTMEEELRNGAFDVGEATKALTEAMKNPISRAKRIAEIEGFLASDAFAKALGSNDPYIAAQAREMGENARKELNALKGPAGTWGTNTAKSWGDGFASKAAIAYVQAQIAKLTSAAAAKLRAQSPPGPESELHDIDKWGMRTALAWGDGFARARDAVANKVDRTLGGLADEIMPGGQTDGVLDSGWHRNPGAAGAFAGTGLGTVSIAFNSIWPPTPEQAREIAKVIDRELSYSVRSQPR